ncbi:unnamed protein product [Darwinula stevensoni]|uniref:Uncharacterized protein n=1 Tax=Darwinula stevensoni TaxID=69355 RepID=A0A7R9AGR4_9CRUS|nr:unnamed protein product [Darwinula stevensoni]CAG0904719.1 unnamed protein product [Darwinula stevensoni]
MLEQTKATSKRRTKRSHTLHKTQACNGQAAEARCLPDAENARQFVTPLYVSPSSEATETDVNFLTDRELEILINEPVKSVIKGDSETERMKFMMEKVRNIVTKWFSKRPITESERILVLGARHDVMENLSASMVEWIVSSAIDACSTWTKMSAKEMRRRIQNLINKNLIFCAFFSDEASGEVPPVEEPMYVRILRGLDMPKMKAFVDRLNKRLRGTTEHPGIHEWQDIRKSNRKFHHIFVLGAHEFNQNFADICKLHLSKQGYFWLLWPEDDLPDTFVAELIQSGFIRPDRKSIQDSAIHARRLSTSRQSVSLPGNSTPTIPPNPGDLHFEDVLLKGLNLAHVEILSTILYHVHVSLGANPASPQLIQVPINSAITPTTRHKHGNEHERILRGGLTARSSRFRIFSSSLSS